MSKTARFTGAPTARRERSSLFRAHPLLVWATLILLFAFFLLPFPFFWVDAANGVTKYAVTPLILINPVVFLVLGLLTGRRYGLRAWIFLAVAHLLFIASTLAVYNDSAIVYAVAYLPLALIGWAVGITLRTIQRRKSR